MVHIGIWQVSSLENFLLLWTYCWLHNALVFLESHAQSKEFNCPKWQHRDGGNSKTMLIKLSCYMISSHVVHGGTFRLTSTCITNTEQLDFVLNDLPCDLMTISDCPRTATINMYYWPRFASMQRRFEWKISTVLFPSNFTFLTNITCANKIFNLLLNTWLTKMKTITCKLFQYIKEKCGTIWLCFLNKPLEPLLYI